MIGTDWGLAGLGDIVGLITPLTVIVGSLQPPTGTDLGMVDLTFLEFDVQIAHKQRGIGPVAEETTSLEHHILTTMIGNELVFAVAKEVALIKHHMLRTPQFHDAVGAIVDIASVHAEVLSIAGHHTVCATTIEVAISYNNSCSAFHTDHTAVAVTALGMTDGKVLNVSIIAVHETQK